MQTLLKKIAQKINCKLSEPVFNKAKVEPVVKEGGFSATFTYTLHKTKAKKKKKHQIVQLATYQ